MSVVRDVVAFMIRGYQVFLSPLLPASCRFQPTCSQYTIEAVQQYGALRGLWLGAKRISKCHPLHPGGFDPVPTNPEQPKTLP